MNLIAVGMIVLGALLLVFGLKVCVLLRDLAQQFRLARHAFAVAGLFARQVERLFRTRQFVLRDGFHGNGRGCGFVLSQARTSS